SVSGGLTFGTSAAHTIQAAAGTLTINAFTLGGAITGGSNNITGIALFSATQASTSAALEVGTYASISGDIKFGGTGAHNLSVSAGSGALTIGTHTLGGNITATGFDIQNLKHLSIGTTTAVNSFYLSDVAIGSSTATASFTITANNLTGG